MKVKLVALKVKGRAFAWWEHLRLKRKIQGESKTTVWEEKEVKRKLSANKYVQTMCRRLPKKGVSPEYPNLGA